MGAVVCFVKANFKKIYDKFGVSLMILNLHEGFDWRLSDDGIKSFGGGEIFELGDFPL